MMNLVRCNPAALCTEASLSIAKPIMKASTCSGSGRPPTDADEKGVPARVTRLVLAVAVESYREIFTVHGIGPALSRVSDVHVV
jgi:hypothetical protein